MRPLQNQIGLGSGASKPWTAEVETMDRERSVPRTKNRRLGRWCPWAANRGTRILTIPTLIMLFILIRILLSILTLVLILITSECEFLILTAPKKSGRLSKLLQDSTDRDLKKKKLTIHHHKKKRCCSPPPTHTS